MCHFCANQESKFQCGSCVEIQYCSESCAKIHWESYHHFECVGGKDDDTWEEGDDEIITLITDENDKIKIEKLYVKKLKLLNRFIEDGSSKEIPIPGIKTITLKSVINFLKNKQIPKFVQIDSLYEFLNGVYYLDVSNFDYKSILKQYNVFNVLMNSNEMPNLNLDIVRSHIIPVSDILLLENFQKKNYNLWLITAKPWLLFLGEKMFPKSFRQNELETINAIYAFIKTPKKAVTKQEAMEVYVLQPSDIEDLNMQDNQYRLNDIIDKVLLKYGSISNLNKIRERENERRMELEKRRRIKMEQIAEAKEILFEKYGHEFDYEMKAYLKKEDILYKSTDDFVKNTIKRGFIYAQSVLSKVYSKQLKFLNVVLTRNPRFFGLLTQVGNEEKIKEGLRFANVMLSTHKEYLFDILKIFESGGIIIFTSEVVFNSMILYYSDEKNPFRFDAFRDSFLKTLNDKLNKALIEKNFIFFRIAMTPEKFKQIIPEIAGQEEMFYFENLELKKK